ncbi:LytR/AlgR family response regulator transcription factor [Tenacibaculum sp. TC6]|uniref:LytR/AlgR family response regulator transcription factor n=1 Tax=Tenacibaculum sp. TC6 TaxID=3423223 RepID=UPI003D36F065
MMHYIIVDDETAAHDIIKEYCDALPNFKLLKHCYDALEALEFLNSHTVDLLFLDLNMPKLKGFDFLKTLHKPPKIIVTTAYKEFALEGYELNIVDYLLKPFSFERFLKAVNKINEPKPIHTNSEELKNKNLFFKVNGKYVQLNPEEILFIEAIGNYCKIVTKTNEIVVRNQLSECMNNVGGIHIIQVHKSFAVAVTHINAIEGNRIYIDQHILPIGRTYKINLQKIMQQ